MPGVAGPAVVSLPSPPLPSSQTVSSTNGFVQPPLPPTAAPPPSSPNFPAASENSNLGPGRSSLMPVATNIQPEAPSIPATAFHAVNSFPAPQNTQFSISQQQFQQQSPLGPQMQPMQGQNFDQMNSRFPQNNQWNQQDQFPREDLFNYPPPPPPPSPQNPSPFGSIMSSILGVAGAIAGVDPSFNAFSQAFRGPMPPPPPPPHRRPPPGPPPFGGFGNGPLSPFMKPLINAFNSETLKSFIHTSPEIIQNFNGGEQGIARHKIIGLFEFYRNIPMIIDMCPNLVKLHSFVMDGAQALATDMAWVERLPREGWTRMPSLGFCSSYEGNCGATLPLMAVRRVRGPSDIAHFTSTYEMQMFLSTHPDYVQSSDGAICYIWP